MKQVIIMISLVFCSSVGLAQSSVYEVPANKIKPDYDKQVPAVKPVVVNTKKDLPIPSLSVVDVTDKNSSAYVSDKPIVVKPVVVDNSGSSSVAPEVKKEKAVVKPVDNSSSVDPVTK